MKVGAASVLTGEPIRSQKMFIFSTAKGGAQRIDWNKQTVVRVL